MGDIFFSFLHVCMSVSHLSEHTAVLGGLGAGRSGLDLSSLSLWELLAVCVISKQAASVSRLRVQAPHGQLWLGLGGWQAFLSRALPSCPPPAGLRSHPPPPPPGRSARSLDSSGTPARARGPSCPLPLPSSSVDSQ